MYKVYIKNSSTGLIINEQKILSYLDCPYLFGGMSAVNSNLYHHNFPLYLYASYAFPVWPVLVRTNHIAVGISLSQVLYLDSGIYL